MQLVTEKIVMLNHRSERIGIQGVREKFGCEPEKVIEMLGLMGDSSDNIPGVRGVGEKTAMKLIGEFGSIEAVYENLENISGKILKAKLAADHENAILSRKLGTINCHVPIPVNLEDVHLGNTDLYDNPEFYALLEELEFNTLLNRLHKKSGKGGRKQETGLPLEHKKDIEKDELMAETETLRSVLEVDCSRIETPNFFYSGG